MTSNNISNLPTPDRPGGSKVGSHFIQTFRSCQMRWFYGWLAPHPTGGLGLEEVHVGMPLLVGLEVHEGLAALYLTDDDEESIKALLEANFQHTDRYWTKEDKFKSRDQGLALLNSYFEAYDPDDLQVVIGHNSKPLVEVELEIDLGYQGYFYTARLDTYVHDKFSHYYPLEHKTVDVGRKSTLAKEMDLSTQATGQIFLATHLLPEMPPTGLIVNMLVKRAAKAATPEEKNLRHHTYRTPQDLEKFRLDITSTLQTLDNAIGYYLDLVKNGMEPYQASRQAFVMQGGKDCSWCQFRTLCLNPETIREFTRGFRARSTSDDY